MFSIHLPPLRERGEDLAMLVDHYLRRFSRELARQVRDISPDALEMLKAYSWPGNIRELESVLKQALLKARGSVLLPAFLPPLANVTSKPSAAASSGTSKDRLDVEDFITRRLVPDANNVYGDTHRQVDRILFTLALEYTRGNHRDAARLLGISRQTMRVKMRSLGLHVTPSIADEGF